MFWGGKGEDLRRGMGGVRAYHPSRNETLLPHPRRYSVIRTRAFMDDGKNKLETRVRSRYLAAMTRLVQSGLSSKTAFWTMAWLFKLRSLAS
jgi:hypothetical protein